MQADMISVTAYCEKYHTAPDFIEALRQNGLLTVTIIEAEPCIHFDDLHDLEMFSNWYYDMNINVEGIDALMNMLERMRNLQQQVSSLQARLSVYERH